MAISVRPALEADIDRLVDIENAVFAGDRLSRRSLRRLVASPSAVIILAEIDGNTIGYAVVLLRRGTLAARLYSIAVAPELAGTWNTAILAITRASAPPGLPASRDRPVLARKASMALSNIGWATSTSGDAQMVPTDAARSTVPVTLESNPIPRWRTSRTSTLSITAGRSFFIWIDVL